MVFNIEKAKEICDALKNRYCFTDVQQRQKEAAEMLPDAIAEIEYLERKNRIKDQLIITIFNEVEAMRELGYKNYANWKIDDIDGDT